MVWHPAKEINRRATGQAAHWQQIQSIYDGAISLEPLPRAEWDYLKAHYIHERRGERAVNVAEAATVLPPGLAKFPLGASEIDFLDFVVNYSRNRVLTLIAPRGAGKTSFLHYVEAVIEKARLGRRKPVFFIFGNLEKLEDSTERLETNCRDLLTIMAGETERRAPKLGERWRKAFGELGSSLRQCRSVNDARECFRTLAHGLPKNDLRRLVLVFDNLDQLDTPVIALVLDLARAIYLVSRVACIVCLRPNCLLGVAQRGDARAFFNYEISLRSPDVSAWIRRLGQRLANQAAVKFAEDRTPLIVSGREITPEQLGNAVERFVALLSNRRPQDDALELLQALCADDIRHLRILVRRMIAHRSFPLLQLLDQEDSIDYHPLPALVGGYNVLYRHDTWVPNLLWWPDPEGSPDFLIFQRLLRVLDRGAPETLDTLISYMDLLDYSRDSTLSALEILCGPSLFAERTKISSMPRLRLLLSTSRKLASTT